MARRMKGSKKVQNWSIIHDFMQEHKVTEIDPNALTEFAISTGRFQDEGYDLYRRCRRELTRTMCEEHQLDPQGRDVRTMAAMRVKRGDRQTSIWFDALEATPKKMHISLSQERRNIVARCRRHKLRTESWNDNNKRGAQLPLFDYNINRDLAEEKMPKDYPDDAPAGDGHDDE